MKKWLLLLVLFIQIWCLNGQNVFTDGFESGNTDQSTTVSGWTQESVSGTYFWTANSTKIDYNRGPNTGTWNAYLHYSDEQWLIRSVDLTAGVLYKFSIYARQDGATSSNANITVKYGNSASASSLTNTIIATTGIINGSYQLLTGLFTPSATQTYYVGIKGYINGTPWYISIDDISLDHAVLADAAPITFSATAPSQTGMTVNWVDNSTNETKFRVYMSTNETTDFVQVGSDVASTTTVATGDAYNLPVTSLLPGTTYYFRIYAVADAESATYLAGNSATSPPGDIATAQNGLWSETTTWTGGVLPSAYDNVSISHKVTVDNTSAVCLSLTVNDTIIYAAVSQGTLTVSSNVTINVGGRILAGDGTLTTHNLIIGNSSTANGNLIVNGALDLNTTAGVTCQFKGSGDGSIAGFGDMDFYAITVNKGTSKVPVLEATSLFSISSPAALGSRLSITNGTFKISTPCTLTPYYGSQTICATTGMLWINDAGASLSCVDAGLLAGAGLATVNGSLRMDAGAFGYGSGSAASGLTVAGTLQVSNATLNIYGRLTFNSTSIFNMTSGNINVDPQAGELCSNTSHVVDISTGASGSFTFTGGNITIVDPHAVSGTGLALRVYTSATTAVFNMAGGTFRFGDGLSDADGSTDGFDFCSFASSTNVPLGNVIVNNNATSVKTTRGLKVSNYASKIGGNLIINAGVANKLDLNALRLDLAGTYTNNGTLYADATNSHLYLNGTLQQSFTPGTLYGSKIYRLTVDNAAGINLNSNLTVEKLTLTNGNINPGANLLTVNGSASADVVVTSGYINGAFARTIPASNTTADYVFPVGKGTYNPFELIDPTTTAGGSVVVKAEVFDADCGGTAGSGLQSLNSDRYWNAQVVSGAAYLTNTKIKLTDASSDATMAIGQSATLTGSYNSLGGSLDATTLTTVNATTELNTKGYFVLGAKAPMVFVSSTSSHPSTDIVAPGAIDAQMLQLQVVTNGADPALNVSQWVFTTSGSTNATSNTDIVNAKLYYTGNSSTFASTDQVGSTITDLSTGTLTFTETFALADGVNYFWLTYDIDAAASNNNVVDATCTSVTVDATPRTPDVTAPAGNRTIFIATPSNLLTENFDGSWPPTNWLDPTTAGTADEGVRKWYRGDDGIVTNSGNAGLNPANGGTGFCADFNTYDIPSAGTAELIWDGNLNLSTYAAASLSFYLKNTNGSDVIRVYIRNASDAWVQIGLASYGVYANWTQLTISLNSYLAYTTADIRFVGTSDYGSTNIGLDDVSITGSDAPNMKYVSSNTSQSVISPVIVGSAGNQMLGVEVATQYSTNPIAMGNLVFNANGSTNIANDILNAKLYYTGTSSTFATTTQVGDAATDVSGDFTFTPVALNLASGTNYFWLTYDIKGTATSTNVVDAECTSVTVGTAQTPTVTAPAGSRVITNDKVLSSITVSQASTATVTKGTQNNEIIKLDFEVTGADATLLLNSIEFASTNTNNTDLSASGVKLWRNSSDDFGTAVQVGVGVDFVSNAALFSGLAYDLPSGHTYFWLSYDVAAGAVSENVLDAKMVANKIDVAGQTYPASEQNPAGNRVIVPAPLSLPLLESFTTWIPSDWKEYTGTPSSLTLANGSWGTGNFANVAGNGAGFKINNYGTDQDWVISPSINLNSLSPRKLRYKVAATSYNGTGTVTMSAEDTVFVLISTDNGATWNTNTGRLTFYTNTNTPLAAGQTDKFSLDGYSGNVKFAFYAQGTGNSPDMDTHIDEFEIYNPTKTFESLAVTQVSDGEQVVPGSENNQILKLDFNVTGDMGDLNLNSIKLTSANTDDSDVQSIQLYVSSTDNYSTAVRLGDSLQFIAGVADFTGLSFNLNEGHNYVWAVYDMEEAAVLGHTLDAYIMADDIDIEGTTYPLAEANPAGSRPIANNKRVVSVSAVQASTADVDKNTSNNPVIKLDVLVEGADNNLPLNNISVTYTGSNSSDVAASGVKIWHSQTDDFDGAVQLGSAASFVANSAAFTGLAFELPAGHNYIWVSCDVATAAITNNLLDVKIGANLIDIAGTLFPSTELNPTGNRTIINAPVTTFPVTESFDGVTFPPTSWRRARNTAADGGLLGNNIVQTTTSTWARTTTATYLHTGAGAAYCTYAAPDYNWLIMPQMTLADAPMKMKFWAWYNNAEDAGTYFWTDFAVMIHADGVWDTLMFWTDGNDPNLYGSEINLDLNSYRNKTVKIAFVYMFTDGWQFAIDDVSVYNDAKVLQSMVVTQASTLPVSTGTTDNPVLKLDFTAAGNVGTLNLNSINVTSANLADADIPASGVKLYRTATDAFATTNLFGTAQSLSGGVATFSDLAYDLPVGHTYVWVCYDIDGAATIGNTVDAKIMANGVDVAGATYNVADSDPVGSRTISNDKFVSSITVSTPTVAAVFKGTVKNAILKLDINVGGSDNTLPLDSIKVTAANTNNADLVTPNGVQIWRNSTDDLSTATVIDSVDYVSNLASFTGINYDLPSGHTYIWVTYDVAAGATTGNVLDAKILMNKISIKGAHYLTTDQNPTGDRRITIETTVPYEQDFNAGTTMIEGWYSNMLITTNHGTGGSNGLNFNLYNSATTLTCYANTLYLGPLADEMKFEFDYRIVNWSGYPGTATTLGASDKIEIQVSPDREVFTTLYTINSGNHVTSTSFKNIRVSVNGYNGQKLFFRILGTWGAGDYYVDFDNIKVRNISSDATLSNLTLSTGTLAPVFDAATKSYTVTLNCDVAVVPTVTPITASTGAITEIINATDLNGDLAARTTTVNVTAEDGITTDSYSVVFEYHPTPAVFSVSGDADFCFGTATGTVALTSSEIDVNYQLKKDGANEGVAKAGDGNPLSWAGINASGVYTVVATNPTTHCSSNMTGSAIIEVYPLPVDQNLTAPAEYCAGSPVTITLEASESDINYQLRKDNSNEGVALAGTGSALTWASMTAGEYTVVATTVDHSCVLALDDTITITENPVPVVYNFTASSLDFCNGSNVDLNLDDSEIGVDYQLKKNNADEGAVVPGTGDPLVWEDMTEGEYQVVATNADACALTMNGALTITNRPYPVDFEISAPADYCAGTDFVIDLAGSESFVNYQLIKNNGNEGIAVAGTGSALQWTGMLEGEYTVVATSAYNCQTAMEDTIVVSEKEIPSVYNLTSSAAEFCDGASVTLTLSNSEVGVDYQLLKGGSAEGLAVTGTGTSLEWTNITEGVYAVVATHPSGCELTMNGVLTITKNPLPVVYDLTAPASYCAGSNVTVNLSNSEIGVTYQLLKDGNPEGDTEDGTGFAIDWTGMTAGTYTMEAVTGEGCSAMMNGTKVVTENPLPTVYTISAPAEYCEGTVVEIEMDGSQNGVNYELFKNTVTVGFSLAGNGDPISWANITAGEYYVVAENAVTHCTSTMTGNLTVSENPLPALFEVSAPSAYCAGNTVAVDLSGSENGTSYQLKKNNVNEGLAVDGTGLALSYANMTEGSYTVLATTGEGCSRNMTGTAAVVENPNPAVYTISAPASYCEGSVVEIEISGSQNGVNYELFKNTVSVGFSLAGNGSDFSWANITAGEYYAVAENATTHCTSTMTGNLTIAENPKPVISNAADFSVCEGTQFDFSPSSVVSSTYAWTTTLSSGNLSYNASGSGDIHEIITNNANTNGVLKYIVTPTSDELCAGDAVNVNVTVYPSAITGNITADEEEICAGESTILHLSGYVGTIQWQKFDGTDYVDVDGQTSVDLATGALSSVSKYIARLTSGSCASVTTDIMTIAVNAIPAAPSSDDVTLCFNEQVPDLSATPDGLNTINWYSDSGLTDLLYTGTTYETGKTAVGTYTYYVTQVSGTCESPATEVVLEIKPLPVVSVLTETDPTSCGAVDGVISLTDDVNYTYAWSGTTATTASISVGAGTYTPTVTLDGCSLILTAISLSDPGAPVITLLSDDGDNIVCNGTQVTFTANGADDYTFTIDGAAAGSVNPLVTTLNNATAINKNVVVAVTGTTAGCQANKQITVVVNPSSVAGTVSASPAVICAGSTTSISLTGAVGNIAWQRSINWDGTNGDWTVNGNTNTSFTSIALDQDTWYKAAVTSGVCSAVETTPFKVAVDQPSVAGTAAADLAVACYNTTAEMELTAYTGAIQWRKSFDGTAFSNIDGYTNATFTTIPLTANVWYQAVVKNGVCPSATSNNAYIEVTPLSVAGNVSVSEATICQNDEVTVSVANSLGTIDWETSVNGTDFTSNLETGVSFAENLMSDTWYRTKVTNGVCNAVYSSAIKVTVNPVSVAGTATANPVNVIEGGNTQLSLTGYTGNIQWEKSFNNTDWFNVAGNGSLVNYTTNAITQLSYYRAKVTNGVCDAVYSNVLTINVTPVYTVSFNVNDGTSNIYEANVVLNGIGSLFTNAAGNCTFNSVVPGTYTYSVTKAGYSLVAGSLEVTDANVVVDPIQINLIYNVNFTVANDLGTAITDADITFNGEALGTGVYAIDSVFAGTYTYNVHKNGHLDANGSVMVTNANVTKPVTLARIFDVTFVVSNDTLGAIADAIVTFDGVAYPAGQYVFDSLLAGSYDYSVELAGHITESGTVVVDDANVIETIALQRVYTVTFAVTDGVNPIADAVVTFNGITNAAGNYVFANVIPANGLAYTVSRATYDTETGTVDLFDQDVTVNVAMDLTRYMVTFNITDGLNSIADAVVSLNGMEQAAGNYVFGSLLPGSYNYYVARATYDTVFGAVVITNANIEEDVVMSLTRYTVTFNITDGANPIADAVVTFNGVTNEAGNYVFANILPGTNYPFTVNRATYDTKTGTFDVGNENLTVTVTMVLTRYTVAFTVTDGTNAIADAIINLDGVTNPAGDYDFASILPGTYDYYVARATYDTVFGTLTILDANLTLPIVMSLTTYNVTFTVSDGVNPIVEAVVTLNGVSNAAGDYVFEDILPGTYDYTVTKTGYNTVSGSVTITDQDVVKPVTMEITRYNVTFVVATGATPITDAVVTLNGIAQAAGQYLFTNILPGTYNYSVVRSGFNTVNGSVTVVNQDVPVNVNMVLTTYTVTFAITDGTNNLSNAIVTLNGVANPVNNYVFTGIVPGTYAYSVTKNGYDAVSGSVTVVDQNITQPIVMNITRYSVTFTVTSGGNAISDAVVTCNGVTNAAGNYVFPNLLPGNYNYSVARTGYITATGNVTVTNQNVSQPVVLNPVTYSVTFTVTDGTNSIADAVVTFNGVTNPAGNYVFAGIVNGTYAYTVAKAGYISASGNVVVNNANVTQPAVLTLITYSVTFTVTDGSAAIADAVVTLNGVTNAAGNYVFNNIVPGTYDYIVAKAGYDSSLGTVAVTDANVVEDVVLELTTYTVTFNVTDGANAITDAVVTFNGVANAAGDYVFEEILPGTFSYTVVKAGYITAGGSIVVLDADVVEDVELELITYTVTFNVTDGTNAVADAVVTLNGITNEANDYIFTDVLPGTYSYTAVKAGYEDATGTVTVTGDAVVEAVLGVPGTYAVTFNVMHDATPIVDAVVTFNDEVFAVGDYVIENLEAGTYSYSVAKEGYVTMEGSVVVANDTIIDVDLELMAYTITFNVTDGTNAIDGAVVTFNGVTNDAGDYIFEGTFAGTYDYVVTKEGFDDATGTVTVNGNMTVEAVLGIPGTFVVNFNVFSTVDAISDAVVTFDGVVYEAGDYIVQNVPEGTYDYSVARNGYNTVDGSVSVAADTTIDVEMEFTPFTVTFNVTDGVNAITDAVVTFNGITNAADDYIFENVFIGMYSYTVTKDGYEDATGVITVDGNMVIEAVLGIPNTYDVMFTVSDNLNPITDAVVTFNSIVYAAGDYIIENQQPGTYSYSIEKANYGTITGEVTITDHDTTIVIIMTDISNVSVASISVYPNPFVSSFTLSNVENISKVVVSDYTGKQIMRVNNNRNATLTIEAAELPQGVYFIHLMKNNRVVAIQKLVKQ